jgi:hypothetical protein
MENFKTINNEASHKLSWYKRFTKKTGEIASRPGLAVALVNDWFNFGAMVITSASTATYDQVGG